MTRSTTIARVVLAVVAAVAAVALTLAVGLFGLLLFEGLGGWPGLRAGFVGSPQPWDPRVSDAKQSAIAVMGHDLSIIGTGMASAPTAERDVCVEGQNNWKVHAGYVWQCRIDGYQLFAFDGDFRTGVLELGSRLDANGWTADQDLDAMLRYYRDGDRVHGIPSTYYYREGSTLWLDFAGRQTPRAFHALENSPDGLQQAADALLEDHEYVVIARYLRAYYEN